LQIELQGGRRIKVRMQQVVLRFDAVPSAPLLPQAQALAESMDVALIWEFAPHDDVDFEQLAVEYFGAKPSAVQRCATLLCLQAAPIWFQRRGRGLFRAHNRAQIEKALASVERRRQLEARIQAWAEALAAGKWPEAWVGSDDEHAEAVDPIALLAKPDRQSSAYRALDAAAKATRLSMPQLVLRTGAIADEAQFHRGVFAREQFPKGLDPQFAPDELAPELGLLRARIRALPIAPVAAFSVDDSSTTEIDDALSVQWHGTRTPSGQTASGGDASGEVAAGRAATGVVASALAAIGVVASAVAVPGVVAPRKTGEVWTIGVHIAVPALLLEPGNRWDRIARERMSTVYAPGEKIQMLPEPIVRAFSLDSGAPRPALSLYLHLGSDFEVVGEETRLEQVPIRANLRHDKLGELVTVEALERWWQAAFPESIGNCAALEEGQSELKALGRLNPQPQDESPQKFPPDLPAEPTRDRPQDLPRELPQDLPQDLPRELQPALALLWRLALHWQAQREAQRGRPEARFRSDFQFRLEGNRVEIVERQRDAPLDRITAELMILANSRWARLLALNRLPGIFRSQQMGKVRMTTHPIAHQGLGVSHYIWATSPLRRYADLVNQRQLLALSTRQRPPFSTEDTDLHAVIAGFDARYDAYGTYQDRMERFWAMRWVEQGGQRRHLAVALREQRVRFIHAPLLLSLVELPEGFAGRRLWIEVLRMDWVELSVEARMLHWDDPGEDAATAEPEER
jgi:exoribonuclease-2